MIYKRFFFTEMRIGNDVSKESGRVRTAEEESRSRSSGPAFIGVSNISAVK